ncbi:PilZ domain-containing protein [Thiomicrorhabdus aquaedulcis]|uniref:PilZ domain-containing protein n=1 Tax=Thiomicrorhabdus aquaedulcis TaxID=2211106 RepID=UPI000FD825DD|nr:PilZ domain-containing protein [Thiomicrorhabdus aquaedulcis]
MAKITHVKTQRQIKLIGKNGTAMATLVSLSKHAVGVNSPRSAQIGTELELEFEIPAFQYFTTLNLLGVVTHRHNTEQGVYLTIEFDSPSVQVQKSIEDFIDYKTRLSEMGKRF